MPMFEVTARVLVIAADENEASLKVESLLDRVGDPSVKVERQVSERP